MKRKQNVNCELCLKRPATWTLVDGRVVCDVCLRVEKEDEAWQQWVEVQREMCRTEEESEKAFREFMDSEKLLDQGKA